MLLPFFVKRILRPFATATWPRKRHENALQPKPKRSGRSDPRCQSQRRKGSWRSLRRQPAKQQPKRRSEKKMSEVALMPAAQQPQVLIPQNNRDNLTSNKNGASNQGRSFKHGQRNDSRYNRSTTCSRNWLGKPTLRCPSKNTSTLTLTFLGTPC